MAYHARQRGPGALKASDVPRAVAAAVGTATALGLSVDDAVVLHDSNRIAVRLRPCGVLARVAYVARRADAEFEVELARRLAETDSPVVGLEPRVEPRAYVRDGFVVTLWTYYEPVPSPGLAPAEYARALVRLHRRHAADRRSRAALHRSSRAGAAAGRRPRAYPGAR